MRKKKKNHIHRGKYNCVLGANKSRNFCFLKMGFKEKGKRNKMTAKYTQKDFRNRESLEASEITLVWIERDLKGGKWMKVGNKQKKERKRDYLPPKWLNVVH